MYSNVPARSLIRKVRELPGAPRSGSLEAYARRQRCSLPAMVWKRRRALEAAGGAGLDSQARSALGIQFGSSPEYQAEIDFIEQSIQDPEVRAYLVEKLSVGKTYEVPVEMRHGFKKEPPFSEDFR